jgi:hypothetical protein
VQARSEIFLLSWRDVMCAGILMWKMKRYIDLIAYYKMNRFHMHISDDQAEIGD